MFKIEYEIKLNDKGRPYIDLSHDYEHRPEDKFFVLEICRYFMMNAYQRLGPQIDPETYMKIGDCARILGQVSDEVAELLYNSMKSLGDMTIMLGQRYYVMVETIEERDNISSFGIAYNGKIYLREIGLKVLVTSTMEIYELVDGVENENWKIINNNES